MYITLNRAGEWKRALTDGLKIEGHILKGLENSGATADSARMITGSVDSFEHDHIWDRVKFNWISGPNTSVRVFCFASNLKTAGLPEDSGYPGGFDDRLAEAGKSEESKKKTFEITESLFKPATSFDGDGLLNCRGRYLWLKLEIAAQDRGSFELHSVKLALPKEKIIDYLPDIYRKGLGENDFFARFMVVFDSIFFALEEDINKIGEKLDYRTANEKTLRYLASWLGADRFASELPAEKLRVWLGSAARKYGVSGTRDRLSRAIENQTGCVPVIVEHFQVESMIYEGRDRRTYSELFGTNPYKIHIMLPDYILAKRSGPAALAEKIKANIPAHVTFELVPLYQGIRLDLHTYLEINSYLGNYSSMVVEERSVLYNDVYIGEIGE